MFQIILDPSEVCCFGDLFPSHGEEGGFGSQMKTVQRGLVSGSDECSLAVL